MRVWMIWMQLDDGCWLEAAWDDDTTHANPDGWEGEIKRCREMAHKNGYEMRVQEVLVPGVFDLFRVPVQEARDVS